jgi:hypothetical protein
MTEEDLKNMREHSAFAMLHMRQSRWVWVANIVLMVVIAAGVWFR